MTQIRLAVIGAGPKGAAIAAKARLINEHRRDVQIEVIIYDKGDYANNWSGKTSYTDGEQELCTPASRDVGFPYDATFGYEVQKGMQKHYSWMSHLVHTNRYADWINRDLKRPTHKEFAAYIASVIRDSGMDCRRYDEVFKLRPKDKKWVVESRDAYDVISETGDFDGVVITGPGPARRVTPGFSHDSLLDGEDLWRNREYLKTRIEELDDEIAIIGGGGTAAAAAAWMIRNGMTSKPINFISDQPTFYTRFGDYFENKVFDDDETWQLLSQNQRRDFVSRTTRAVVWTAVSEQLASAKNLKLLPGRVISLSSGSRPELVSVKYRPSNSLTPPAPMEFGLVIDASGFDMWWFKKLLPKRLHPRTPDYFETLAESMTQDLALPLPGLPPLHVPMASWSQGPGFSSLMVLGRMADRILSRYAEPFFN